MAISAHGGLYGLASLDYGRKDLILRFDLADETFRYVPLPPPRRLSLWGGFLSIFSDSAFWVMKGDGEQVWTKVMTISEFPGPQGSTFSYFLKPICLTKSGKVVILVDCERFILYDPNEQTVRELHIRGLQNRWLQETLYFESLVSPRGGKCMRL